MAAKKKTAKGYELLVAELKKNKNAAYADLKAKAEKKGFVVYPVMFGRAKASLGLVKVAKYGSGKAAKKKLAKRGPGRPRKGTGRGPGRPPKARGGAVDVVRDLLSSMQETERENQRLRTTLERVRELIDRAI